MVPTLPAISKWFSLTALRSLVQWIFIKIGLWGAVFGLLMTVGTVILAWGVPVWALVLISAAALAIFLWLILGVVFIWSRFVEHRPTDENKKIVGDYRRLAREIIEHVTEYNRLDPTSRNIELLASDREKFLSETMKFSTVATAAFEQRFSTRIASAVRFFVRNGLMGPMDLFGYHINPLVRKAAAEKIDAAACKFAERCGIDPENY